MTDPSQQAAPERGGSVVPAKVSIGHLPQPERHFVGREDELALLDQAWEDPTTNIIEFVAFGGVGKSALVAEWLKRMRADGWRGAVRVFGHSFYSQGSREDAQASADAFLDQALRFFEDPDPTEGAPWDKGERLAGLVRERPTLLILDGVEPLQLPGSGGDAGQIRDPGLQALVRELASGIGFQPVDSANDRLEAYRAGLTVISTRARVRDIEGYEDTSVRCHELKYLSPEAGADLLGQLGVSGTDDERADVSRQVNGHGLALTLLGTYLKKAFGGDITRVGEIGLLQADGREGSHACHMMRRYERFLGESPELAIVRLLGLFDRPATAGEMAALTAAPPIPGLTEPLVGLSEPDWNYAVANLREYGLLAAGEEMRRGGDKEIGSGSLDAHPLIREYFAESLQRVGVDQPDVYVGCSSRLAIPGIPASAAKRQRREWV